jgi:hypothetical protein
MTANAKAIATTWYDLDSAVYFDSSFKLFALISPIKVTHTSIDLVVVGAKTKERIRQF